MLALRHAQKFKFYISGVAISQHPDNRLRLKIRNCLSLIDVAGRAFRGPQALIDNRVEIHTRSRDYAAMLDPKYPYYDAEPTWANAYLWPELRRFIDSRPWPDRRAFDLGCGNGATANLLKELDFAVTAIDPSPSGVDFARGAFPHILFERASAYDDLRKNYGQFPLVVSLEVIEHCADVRAFARTFFDLVEEGGAGFLSTPYHGYLKNIAIAAAGYWDSHHSPLWDGGHLKFFSIDTLGILLRETGFNRISFRRVGRIPQLAKSMIAIAQK